MTQSCFPKRRYVLHNHISDLLETYESAALGDADSDGLCNPNEHAQRRAVLSQFPMKNAILKAHLLHLCDGDLDLQLRLRHVILHVAHLRIVVLLEEALSEVARRRLPKSYVPFDTVFQCGRQEWMTLLYTLSRLWSGDRYSSTDGILPGKCSVRLRIEATFFNVTLAVIEKQVKLSSTVGWRLLHQKLWMGSIGPVARDKLRHRTILRRVVVLIAADAVMETIGFYQRLLNCYAAYDALLSVTACVTSNDSTSFLSTDSATTNQKRVRLLVFLASTAMQMTKLLVNPFIEDLSTDLRLDLGSEWVYECSVKATALDEAMRVQPEAVKVCNAAALKRTCTITTDWLVRVWVRGAGCFFSGVCVMAIGQVFWGERGLPLFGLCLGALQTCSLWLFGLWQKDSVLESGEVEHLLEDLDNQSIPVQEPLFGLRVLLQTIVDQPCSGVKSFHIGVLCASTVVSYGEGGCIPLLDDAANIKKIVQYAQYLQRSRLPVSARSRVSAVACAVRELQFVIESVLKPQLALLQQKTQSDGGAALREHSTLGERYLDAEETILLQRGAAYIELFDSWQELLVPRKLLTLRALGLEAVHAYHSLVASLAKNHAKLTQGILQSVSGIDLFEVVREELSVAVSNVVLQIVIAMVMEAAVPLWLQPTYLHHKILSGSSERLNVSKLLLTNITSYARFFTEILGFPSVGKRAAYGDHRAWAAVGLEELLRVLPEFASDRMEESSSAERLQCAQLVRAMRPELLFNSANLICGNFVMRKGVGFHNVSFEYPNSGGHKALDGLSFTAPAGDFTAIMGKTGSGKSTLVQLLRRKYHPLRSVKTSTSLTALAQLPTDNVITIDGIPLFCFDAEYVRQIMAFVPQQPHVVPDLTFAQNIAMLRPLTMDQIVKAAKLARCHEFITSFPLGYDQPAGQQMSGGEEQRIEIARAIAGAPQILLLDEATSKLDAKNEALIQDAIVGLVQSNCTILSIAHRLSTLKCADRYVVLHHGKAVQEGTHDELMTTSASTPAGISYKEQLALQRLSDVPKRAGKPSVVPPESLSELERRVLSAISATVRSGENNSEQVNCDELIDVCRSVMSVAPSTRTS